MTEKSRNQVIVGAIFFTLYYYLGRKLITHTDFTAHIRHILWAVLAIPFLLTAWIPFIYWEEEEPVKIQSRVALLQAGMISLGLLSFIFTFTLMRDVLSMSIRMANLFFNIDTASIQIHFYQGYTSGGILTLSLLCCLWGVINLKRGPRIVEKSCPIQNLHKDLEDFKIVLITDLHVSGLIDAGYVQKVVQLVNSLNPDVIALTGDLVDGTLTEPEIYSGIRLLNGLTAKLGKFFVTGNHETYWDIESWCKELINLQLTPLFHRHVILERNSAKILFAGVPFGSEDPKKALENAPMTHCKVLLAHDPRVAFVAAPAGFDLMLSGHTHAGQFWPWTWVIHFVQPYIKGLYRFGNLSLYVSPGTGVWGPPIRLGTQSEITLLKLSRF